MACALYKSLHGYIQAMWSTFSDIDHRSKDLTECGDYQQQPWREHKWNHKFKTCTFLVNIGSLLSALSKCQKAYQMVNGVFGFLCQLQSFTPKEIAKRPSNLMKSYPEDLEESLGKEFVKSTKLLKTNHLSHIVFKQDIVELQFYHLSLVLQL